MDVSENLENLTHLSFGYYFNQPIDVLENLGNLTHLSFGLLPTNLFIKTNKLEMLWVNGNDFDQTDELLDNLFFNF